MSLSRFILLPRRASLLNDAIFQDSVSDLSSNRVRTQSALRVTCNTIASTTKSAIAPMKQHVIHAA